MQFAPPPIILSPRAAYHRNSNMLRFGCHDFINALPILRGLKADSGGCALVLDKPSALARMLHERRLDVAVVPAVEYLRNADYVIVPDVCVAALGRVESVNLYCRRPPDEIGLIALDPSSLTSVILLDILMRSRFGVRPRYSAGGPLRLGDLPQTEADAVLVIGDEALRKPPPGYQAIDLAEQWHEMTGLPFVFALCCARRGADLKGFGELLKASLARGLREIPLIAAEAAPRTDLTPERIESYLTENLRYQLGKTEQAGLRRFFAETVRANLWTEERDLEFHRG